MRILLASLFGIALLAAIPITLKLLSENDGTSTEPACDCYTMFIDQSASISSQQRAHWMGEAEKIIASIKPGDSITTYSIHDQTLRTKPHFEAHIPPLDEDAGLDDQLRVKQKLVEAKNGTREALQKALDAAGQAPKTDIFSAFDRSSVGQRNCRVALFFFSDCLHAAERDEINLEQTRLVEDRFPQIIEATARRHGWRNNTLKGAAVYAILPSAQSGQGQPLNDVRILKAFYQSMVSSIGGQLVSFETTLDERLVNYESGK